MKIAIGSDAAGASLKVHLIDYMKQNGYEVLDGTPLEAEDFIDAANEVASAVLTGEAEKGILIDEYGAGVFMAANKIPGIICAVVSEEHSAKMTRNHNNASVIALGSSVVGKGLAESICQAFLSSEYEGGRHQVRVDMLGKMC